MNGRPLADAEELTHYGKKEPRLTCCSSGTCQFRHLLRSFEKSLSVVLGHLSPKDVGPKIGQPSGGARYTTVGTLRTAGFIVKHTPNQENPEHVSVHVTDEWTRDHGDRFNACFGEPEWVDDQEEQT